MTFTGRQKISVSWRKDGKLIWASYQYNVQTTDCGCRLDVLNSDREEASGRYTCEISSSEGSDICHANVKLGKVTKHAQPAEAHYSWFTCRLHVRLWIPFHHLHGIMRGFRDSSGSLGTGGAGVHVLPQPEGLRDIRKRWKAPRGFLPM